MNHKTLYIGKTYISPMKRHISQLILFSFLLSLFLIIPPASAGINTTDISITDLGLMTTQDIEIYGLNTTSATWELLGTFNTTSQGLQFEPGKYQMVFRPSAKDRFSNLATLFPDTLSWFQTYWIQFAAFLIFVTVVAAVWGGRSPGRRGR